MIRRLITRRHTAARTAALIAAVEVSREAYRRQQYARRIIADAAEAIWPARLTYAGHDPAQDIPTYQALCVDRDVPRHSDLDEAPVLAHLAALAAPLGVTA